MTTLPEFCKMLTRYDGRDEASISHVGRVAREAGYIVAGKRGRGGPHLDVKSAANLLIALNGAEFPKDAPLAIDRFRSLTLLGALGAKEQFKDLLSCRTFGEALEYMITSNSLFNELFGLWLAKTKPKDVLTESNSDDEWFQAFEARRLEFIPLMTSAGKPFLVSVEMSRYIAKIIILQSWDRKMVFEANYTQADDRILEGFYGSKSYDRKVTCKFGFDTILGVSSALTEAGAD